MDKRELITSETLSSKVLNAQYAVRGELAIRAEQLALQLKQNKESLPFERIINCNIGNPQQLHQQPITFFRQVLSAVQYPALLDEQDACIFPSDVIQRARDILNSLGGHSLGAYSHSQGVYAIRMAVAEFILNRDGLDCRNRINQMADEIFLCNGASEGVKFVLQSLIRDESDGVMIPKPRYPLYSATIALYGGTAVYYNLIEEQDWSLSESELKKAYDQAVESNCKPRVLCLVNPSNPTGSCFDRQTIMMVARFCDERGMLLLADEVYQENVYISSDDPNPPAFCSVFKVVYEADLNLQLISFHSTSKGFLGECGQRGGYYHCHNIDQSVIRELYKISSISLCPNLTGQVLVWLMVTPPRNGDQSYDLYMQEIDRIKASLHRRAVRMHKTLTSMKNVTCQPVHGAMYLFPRITFPKSFEDHAVKVQKKLPDVLYSLQLLEATGICVVPGSGFGQSPGTFHIRTTFLPSEDHFDDFLNRWMAFHQSFMSKWM